jgi:hypothetical protein
VSVALLPSDSSAFITITMELANVQRELGLSSDARLSLSNANQALRASGSPDRVPTAAEFEVRSSRPPASTRGSQPPDSGVQHNSETPPNGEAMMTRLRAAVKP